MCTLTLLSSHAGDAHSPPSPRLRLMMNRDELRTRPRALPPALHTLGSRSILMPIDPLSRGTWIGINDHAVFAALLNLTQPGLPITGRSRGGIIPAILQHSTFDLALAAAQSIFADGYTPFRLLLGSPQQTVLLRSIDGHLEHLTAPVLLTSSGLGDDLVHPPRAALFSRTLASQLTPSARPDHLRQSQDHFHHHFWPDQPALSVLMDRPDARTVSITTIEITSIAATMHYQDLLVNQHSSSQLPLHQTILSSAT